MSYTPILLEPHGATYSVLPSLAHRHFERQRQAEPLSAFGDGCAALEKSMCLFRWRGETPPPGSSTVMRFWLCWPRTVWPAKIAGTLEAVHVPRLGVRDVDLPVHRIDGHVVEDRCRRPRRSRRPRPRRRIRHRVDGEHVLVGQVEPDEAVVPRRGRCSSTQSVPLNFTIVPTCGCGTPA